MKYLTTQQIFSHAAKHLVKQKKRCESFGNGDGACLLFGRNGARCAIGAFLRPSDKVVLKEMGDLEAGMSQLLAAHDDMLTKRGLNGNDPAVLGLLRELQYIHDAGNYANRFTALARLARRHGFTMPKALEKALAC